MTEDEKDKIHTMLLSGNSSDVDLALNLIGNCRVRDLGFETLLQFHNSFVLGIHPEFKRGQHFSNFSEGSFLYGFKTNTLDFIKKLQE